MLSYDCRDGMSSTIYTLDTEKSAPPDQPVALARYVLLCYFNRAVVVSEDCSGVALFSVSNVYIVDDIPSRQS